MTWVPVDRQSDLEKGFTGLPSADDAGDGGEAEFAEDAEVAEIPEVAGEEAEAGEALLARLRAGERTGGDAERRDKTSSSQPRDEAGNRAGETPACYHVRETTAAAAVARLSHMPGRVMRDLTTGGNSQSDSSFESTQTSTCGVSLSESSGEDTLTPGCHMRASASSCSLATAPNLPARGEECGEEGGLAGESCGRGFGGDREGGGSAVEGGSGRQQCRICLECDGRLIAPCECRGTQRYVHRSCLDAWRAAKNGIAFSRCSECRAPFALRARVAHDRAWRRLQFRVLLLRDHAALFTLVQLVVGVLGVISYHVFGSQLRDQLGFQDRPQEFYSFAATLLALLGIVYGALVSVLCSDYITERHAHVQQRKQLTEEFVVVDLSRHAHPTPLPAHLAQELASLGLM